MDIPSAPVPGEQRSGAGAVLDAAVIVAALGHFVDIHDRVDLDDLEPD